MLAGLVCDDVAGRLKIHQVSANKTKTESGIRDTLVQIRDRLPEISLYDRIYNSGDETETQLQRKIVETYLAFIEFSIEATRYYRMPGPGERRRHPGLEGCCLT